jgi:hypothetical protein
MSKNDECFVRITNKDVYNKLQSQEDKIDKLLKKVSVSFWMSSTALTLAILAVTSVLSFCRL